MNKGGEGERGGLRRGGGSGGGAGGGSGRAGGVRLSSGEQGNQLYGTTLPCYKSSFSTLPRPHFGFFFLQSLEGPSPYPLLSLSLSVPGRKDKIETGRRNK